MLRSNSVFTISSGVPSGSFADISEKLLNASEREAIFMGALDGISNGGF